MGGADKLRTYTPYCFVHRITTLKNACTYVALITQWAELPALSSMLDEASSSTTNTSPDLVCGTHTHTYHSGNIIYFYPVQGCESVAQG